MTTLSRILSQFRQQEVADRLGVTAMTVSRWAARGLLPRTAYTGEVPFARQIAEMAAERGIYVTPDELLIPYPEARPERAA